MEIEPWHCPEILRTTIREDETIPPEREICSCFRDTCQTFQMVPSCTLAGRSELAKAIRYARSRWVALNRYIQDGRLEISNNAVENAIRPLKVGSKNWLFLGSDSGGVTAARFYTIIRTCVLNGVEPEAYLREVLGCIGEFPINRISELLPWNFATRKERSLAA